MIESKSLTQMGENRGSECRKYGGKLFVMDEGKLMCCCEVWLPVTRALMDFSVMVMASHSKLHCFSMLEDCKN